MRTHFLSLPFSNIGYGNLDVTYNKALKRYIHVGDELPDALKPYASPDFSLIRWEEDNYNKAIAPTSPVNYTMKPRPHQVQAAKGIAAAKKAGWRGYIEGDNVGLGKTISTAYGIYGAMKVTGQKNARILIVCPKSVFDHWENTFKALRIPNVRICIINYESLDKLLEAPATANKAKKSKTVKSLTKTKGKPKYEFDYIIADESQKLKNWQTSINAQAFGRIAGYTLPNEKAPFVIFASATIGQTPIELQYLKPLFYQATKEKATKSWAEWLTERGFDIKVSDKGVLSWANVHWKAPEHLKFEKEEIKKKDLIRMNRFLKVKGFPMVRRNAEEISNWPKPDISKKSMSLSIQERIQYQTDWMTFRRESKLAQRGNNPKNGLAAQIRFRQKSSLLRVPSFVDIIEEYLENNVQIVVYVHYAETIQKMKAELKKRNIPVSEFTSSNKETRIQEKMNFQKGKTKVILFSTPEAISLHQGEMLADGTKATDVKRITFVYDMPYSGILSNQIAGRAHRDGQHSPVFFMYGKGTAEERVTEIAVTRMLGITTIMDDEKFAEELGKALSDE